MIQFTGTKIRACLGLLLILLISSFTVRKVLTLSFSEEALNSHFQRLNTIKAMVDKSNLPHQEVMYITNSIDSLQREILMQVKPQLSPELKK